VGLDPHLLGLLLHPNYARRRRLWRNRILPRLVQDHLLCRLFLRLFLGECRSVWNGYIGFRYWTRPQGPVVNGINAFGQVFALAASYYVGMEVISLTAAETKDPRKSIPRLCMLPAPFLIRFDAHMLEANNSPTGCQYRCLSHPLCLHGTYIAPRSHLPIRLTCTPKRNLKSRFIPSHYRLCSSWMEISRSIYQPPHYHRVHFR